MLALSWKVSIGLRAGKVPIAQPQDPEFNSCNPHEKSRHSGVYLSCTMRLWPVSLAEVMERDLLSKSKVVSY